MSSPIVSILMPVKNAQDFLEACVDSILDQTFENWELIAIDDHSDDSSAKLLEKISKADSRIHWYRNPAKGIVAALDFAFKKS